MDTSIFLTDELPRARRASGPIRPYRIHVPDAALVDLDRRLAGSCGEPAAVGELARAWRDFDWRGWEASLAEWPGFRTEIDGADVHFLHVRSPEAGALPLLLLPGRAGGLVSLVEVVGPLGDPRAHAADPAQAFHLVIATPPGQGFSGPPRDHAWDERRMAAAASALMLRLGYPCFGVHGAELSVDVACELGDRQLDRVVGVHLGAPRWRPAGEAGELSPAGLVALHAEDFVARDREGRARFLAELSLAWFTGGAGGSIGGDPELESPEQLVAELRDFFRRS